MCDRQFFVDAFDDLGIVYGQEVSLAQKRLYWEDLEHLSNKDLQAAIRAHRRDPERGRFFPRPADLLAKAGCAASCHLPADAAWSVALQSLDEAATVVWTAEIAQAREVARPIWAEGDPVGARMAFRAAYEQIVSRGSGPPVWAVSLGHDAALRKAAIEDAELRGLIGRSEALRLLPPDQYGAGDEVERLALPGNVSLHPNAREGRLRQLLRELRGEPAEVPRSKAQRERQERIAAAKAQALADLAALGDKRGSGEG